MSVLGVVYSKAGSSVNHGICRQKYCQLAVDDLAVGVYTQVEYVSSLGGIARAALKACSKAGRMAGSRSLLDAYGHYIGGHWIEPDSGRYDVVNPATETVLETAPDASVAQVQQAIAAARSAFDTGPWPDACNSSAMR